MSMAGIGIAWRTGVVRRRAPFSSHLRVPDQRFQSPSGCRIAASSTSPRLSPVKAIVGHGRSCGPDDAYGARTETHVTLSHAGPAPRPGPSGVRYASAIGSSEPTEDH